MSQTPVTLIYLLFAALAANLIETTIFLWFNNNYGAEWLGVIYAKVMAYAGSTMIFFLVYLPILAKNPKHSWTLCFAIMLPLNTVYLLLLNI